MSDFSAIQAVQGYKSSVNPLTYMGKQPVDPVQISGREAGESRQTKGSNPFDPYEIGAAKKYNEYNLTAGLNGAPTPGENCGKNIWTYA